jgi:branched-chain amino acid transport system ATP-binding protein
LATHETLLVARDIEAGYGPKQILFGASFEIARGEVVALLGANGSGKSTLLNSVSGFVRPSAGSIRLESTELVGMAPYRTFRRGVVQISQARDLFPAMTVADNLKLGAFIRRPGGESALATVHRLFPRLQERSGQVVSLMSGGEQQMVAMGRALMANPRLLLLDEPSGGLAPKVVTEIADALLVLKSMGTTMLIVEQNVKLALAVADRFLILKNGRVSERGEIKAARTLEEEIVRNIYL